MSVLLLALPLSAALSSCGGDDDEPDVPANVPTEKQEVFIACFDSNSGELPSYATVLYEDSEYQYRIAARSPRYELIILPYRKVDGEWEPLYTYTSYEEVGEQLKPVQVDGKTVCSIMKYPHALTGSTGDILSEMTQKLGFESDSHLSMAPFQYRNAIYGYLTVENNVKVHIKFYCSFLKMNHSQGSSSFGYIASAKLEYQFY